MAHQIPLADDPLRLQDLIVHSCSYIWDLFALIAYSNFHYIPESVKDFRKGQQTIVKLKT